MSTTTTAAFSKWTTRWKLIAVIYFIVTVILYIQSIVTDRYNNFIIFRASLSHLLAGKPLYLFYPNEYRDMFLYHPSFPVLFAPFALLPKEIGLLCWLLGSTALFIYMIRQLPFKEEAKCMVMWFLLIELSNAIQSAQTNPAIAALMVLTVVNLQRQKSALAALFAALCFFIKGYGAIAAIAFLWFPRKGAFITWGLIWGVIGTALPLLFITPAQLLQNHIDWITLLTSPVIKEGGSLLGMLHTMTGMSEGMDRYLLIVAIGMLIYMLVKARDAYLVVAYLMIWIVIFNQATESPTYIIAVTGVAISCYALPLQQRWRAGLLWLTIALTSLAPTDLVPKFINYYAVNYFIKAFACTINLIVLQAWVIGWRNPKVFNSLTQYRESIN
jgi:hypothetical protein